MALNITGTLNMLGSATFSSSSSQGFTTLNYTQAVPGSVVTLKSGVTYTVSGQLTITGSATSRCTLQATSLINLATGSVTPGSPSGTLNISSVGVTITSPPSGYYNIMSQSPTNTPLLRRGVAGMNGSNVASITSFPTVPPGTSPGNFTLGNNRSFTMSSRNIQIGLTTIFIHNSPLGDAARSLNYVTTFDIDSTGSTGGTIKADNSYPNRVGTPNPNLWRSINWDSLVPLTPLVTVAYVE